MIQQAFVKHHCTELHYVFSTSQLKLVLIIILSIYISPYYIIRKNRVMTDIYLRSHWFTLQANNFQDFLAI